MKTVKIELPDEDADALERVAVDGGFASSSEFVLAAIGDLITAPIAYDPDVLARDVAERKAAKRRGMPASHPKKPGPGSRPIDPRKPGLAMNSRKLILRDGAARGISRAMSVIWARCAVRGIAFAEAWSEALLDRLENRAALGAQFGTAPPRHPGCRTFGYRRQATILAEFTDGAMDVVRIRFAGEDWQE